MLNRVDNYRDVSSIYTASWLQSCPVVKFTDCSWLRGPIKLIIIIRFIEGEYEGKTGTQRSTLFSKVQICMENGHAVIATSAQLKTPLSGSSPSIPHFFSLHFNSNQVEKHSPSIILQPNDVPPTTPFYWLMLPGLFML